MVSVVGLIFAAGLVAYADDDPERKADELRREADGWIGEARAVYRLDCESMEQIWEAFCAADWEPNEEPDRDSARSKANEIKDRQIRKIEGLLDQYNKLKSRAEELKQDKTRGKAERILDDIKKEFDRIEKLKDKGAWKGTSHPPIQYAVEYGKDRHRGMESSSSYGCQVKDKPFPGGADPLRRRKPDRFQQVGRFRPVRIDRLRVAFAA